MTKLDKERWLPVKGSDGSYEISSFGKVKSLPRKYKRKKIIFLKPAFGKDMGLNVVLCKNCVCKTTKVHRIVATTFIPNPENKPEVNHIDGNRANNRVENLEWCTRSENEKHAYRINLKNRVGQNNPRSKLTTENIKKIRKMAEVINQKEIAKQFKVTPQCIGAIVRRENWSHV